MGMAEVYLALKTGTIDGQENPLSILKAAKLYEVSATSRTDLPHAAAGVHQHRHARLGQAVPAATEGALCRKPPGRAAKANDDGRLADEADPSPPAWSPVELNCAGRRHRPGTAFRAAMPIKVYAASDMASRTWEQRSGLKQVLATRLDIGSA